MMSVTALAEALKTSWETQSNVGTSYSALEDIIERVKLAYMRNEIDIETLELDIDAALLAYGDRTLPYLHGLQ